MANSNTFGGTIKLEGAAEYRKSLSQIGSDLRVLGSEMGKVTAEFGKNDKSTNGLTQKNKVLADQIDKQKEKVTLLKGALADSAEQYGESDKKTQNWQVSLNKAEADLIKMEKELENNEKALDESGQAAEDTAKSVDEFGNETEDAGKQTSTFGDTLKALAVWDTIKAGVSMTIDGIKNMAAAMSEAISGAATYADNILVMSQTTGLSTKSLQEFSAIAELTDVSMETLEKSMTKNIKSMGSAQGGTGAAAEAYKKLGIAVTDSNGQMRDGEDVYWDTIEALGKMENETERDAMSMQLLGKSARDLNPILGKSSEEMARMKEYAYEMGVVLSDDVLNSLADVDDQIQIFTKSTESMSNLVGAAFAPMASNIMAGVSGIVQSFNMLLSTIVSGGDIEGALENFTDFFKTAINSIASAVPQVLEMAGKIVTTLAEGISRALPSLLPVIQALIPTLIDTIMASINQLIPIAMQIIMVLVQGIIAALPSLINGAIQIVASIVAGISSALPTLLPAVVEIIMAIVNGLLNNLDLILGAAIQFLFAIIEAIPPTIEALLNALPTLIDNLINFLIENIPLLIDGAIKLFNAIILAIPKIIVTLVQKLPDIIFSIVNALTKPETIGILLVAAVQMFMALVTAIPKITIEIVKSLPQIINGIIKTIGSWWSAMANAGTNLLKGLWQGISDAGAWLWNKISGFFGGIMDKIKGFFGIKSPSTLFKNVIGKNLALGLGEGFSNEMNTVAKDMQNAIPTEFDVEPIVNTGYSNAYESPSATIMINPDYLVSAFQKALTGMAFMVDGDKFGEMAVSKVGRVIFA